MSDCSFEKPGLAGGNGLTGRNPLGGIATSLALVSTSGHAQDKRGVKIGLASASISTGAVRIAQELGIYDKHGLAPGCKCPTRIDRSQAAHLPMS
jgi:hypothetical protein